MAASDWTHYDPDRGGWGYYTEDGVWHPRPGNPAHTRETHDDD